MLLLVVSIVLSHYVTYLKYYITLIICYLFVYLYNRYFDKISLKLHFDYFQQDIIFHTFWDTLQAMFKHHLDNLVIIDRLSGLSHMMLLLINNSLKCFLYYKNSVQANTTRMFDCNHKLII